MAFKDSGDLLFRGSKIGSVSYEILEDSASVKGVVDGPEMGSLFKAWRAGAAVKIESESKTATLSLDSLDPQHPQSVLFEGRLIDRF